MQWRSIPFSVGSTVRRRRGRALLLAVAVAIAGCSFAPAYRRPDLPVDDRFPTAPGGGGGLAAADHGWRDVFGDLRLQQLIELALRDNRDLRIAVLDVELARAQYGIERGRQFPRIDAGARADVFGFGGRTAELYQVNIAAGYELDLFGRVRSLKAEALEEYLATEAARRAAHLCLVAEVVTRYLRLRALDEQHALATRAYAAARDLAAVTTGSGRAELDVRTAEAHVQGMRAEVARLARLRAQAENALVQVVGRPLPATPAAALPLDADALVADVPAGLPSDLLFRRPDILAAEHALRGANAQIGGARSAFFPVISLTSVVGYASRALLKLVGGGATLWTFAPQITVPLFSGGRNKANLSVAKVRKQIEIARYEQAIQAAFREVADALVARAHLDEQLDAQRARVAAEEQRSALAEDQYRDGTERHLAVLHAQRDLYASRVELVELEVARLSNRAALYAALGGGWFEHSAIPRARPPAPAKPPPPPPRDEPPADDAPPPPPADDVRIL